MELLVNWYRARARSRLGERLAFWSAQLGVAPRRIAVRDQRSRWGSCSSAGNINLNWRLLLLPTSLSDYVLVHELCHLRRMDHSPAFWNEVARVLPDWRERRRELRRYPRERLAFRAADVPGL